MALQIISKSNQNILIDPMALKIQAPVNKEDKISIFLMLDSPIDPKTETSKVNTIKISNLIK